MATVFETETCGRCGGSGHYSFNLTDGTRCFGCGGSGKRMTKRGAAAKAFYLQLVTIKAHEVQPGDWVNISGLVKKMRVERIEPFVLCYRIVDGEKVPQPGLNFISPKGNAYGCSPDDDVVKLPTTEQQQALFAEALAYQATLTKQGRPRKAGQPADDETAANFDVVERD